MNLDELLRRPQYSIPQAEKEGALLEELTRLGASHRERCRAYARICDVLFPSKREPSRLADLPFLPVALFKEHRLLSVPESEVFKVLESSRTTGQMSSRIFLDRETAQLQTLALSRIMTHALGPQRLPMLLVESAGIVQDRLKFNARAAGLLGMMNFGRSHVYALDSELSVREREVRAFLDRFSAAPFLIFGFTFLVWTRFFEFASSASLDLSNGILVHTGGWKKLQERAVGAAEFRTAFRKSTGLTRMYNFYGMAEQVGSVFLEGEDGYLYPPNFADVILRDPITFEEVPPGTAGVVQVLSALPGSYPGHSLLTEDLGVVHAVDPASCGRHGKAFSILGRIPKAELRGCSDVIAAKANG